MKLATTDKEVGIREMAVRALVARKADALAIAKDEKAPASVRAEAVAGVSGDAALPLLQMLIVERRSLPPTRGNSTTLQERFLTR